MSLVGFLPVHLQGFYGWLIFVRSWIYFFGSHFGYGKNGNNKYSLHNTNRNGQHLTDFMIENILACLNTNYQKREGKLWTYTYVNNTKAQIDYVLINKKWKNSAMNCEAYSSFEGVSTDHRIVTAKIRLSLRKNAKRTATTKHYDWALLNNRDIRDKYVLELRNRFETLQEKTEKSTPNDEYENFINAHLEAAAKCIPTKLKTKYRVPWETLAVREKRALVKTASKNYRYIYIYKQVCSRYVLIKIVYIYIFDDDHMYIYISCHLRTDCFDVSQLISAAGHAIFFKL